MGFLFSYMISEQLFDAIVEGDSQMSSSTGTVRRGRKLPPGCRAPTGWGISFSDLLVFGRDAADFAKDNGAVTIDEDPYS